MTATNFALANRNSLAKYLSRGDSTALITESGTIESAVMSLAPGNAAVLFHDPPQTLPKTLVFRDDEIEDSIAWALTYIDHVRPLTAFVSAESQSSYLGMLRRKPLALDSPILRAALGVVVVEAGVQVRNRRSNEITLLSSLRSISSVFAQALRQGYDVVQIGDAARLWIQAREGFRSAELPYPVTTVLDFWNALIQSTQHTFRQDADGRFEGVVKDALMGKVGSNAWGQASPDFRFAAPLMQLRTREEQIGTFFNNIVPALRSSKEPRLLIEAYTGYLLALLAKGQFEYWQTATEVLQFFPTTPLWFGAFAAQDPQTNILAFSGSLGRRLTLELYQRDQPFDVDAKELIIAKRSSNFDVPTAYPNTVVAKLLEGVVAWLTTREPSPVTSPAESASRQSSKEVFVGMSGEDLQRAREMIEVLNTMFLRVPRRAMSDPNDKRSAKQPLIWEATQGSAGASSGSKRRKRS